MSRLVIASLFALFSAGCGANSVLNPPAEEVDTIASCEDSGGNDCVNQGRPMCVIDHDRACRMCQCSAYSSVEPTIIPQRIINPAMNPYAYPGAPYFIR